MREAIIQAIERLRNPELKTPEAVPEVARVRPAAPEPTPIDPGTR